MVAELDTSIGLLRELFGEPTDTRRQRKLPELQAPVGTFALLKRLEVKGLGSVYTKRYVSVKTDESILDRLEVEVRIKGKKLDRGRQYTYYKFGISNNDQVDTIVAEQDPEKRKPGMLGSQRITPPPFVEI